MPLLRSKVSKIHGKSVDSFDAGVYSAMVDGIVKRKRDKARRKDSGGIAVREVSPADSPRV